MRSAGRASLLLLGVMLAACGGESTNSTTGTGGSGGGDDHPPIICRTPTPRDGPWYTEITAEVGLAKTDALEPLATSVVAADLDGDGYQDFYAAVFPSQREPTGTKRTRF